MLEIPFYQVDASASAAFAGNPAGVCLLDAWLPDLVLQAVAGRTGVHHCERRDSAQWRPPCGITVSICLR
jgi:hypothetical protein